MISGNQRSHQRRSASRGQVTLEYFILFAAVAMATLIVVTSLDDQIKTTLENFFTAAVHAIDH